MNQITLSLDPPYKKTRKKVFLDGKNIVLQRASMVALI